MSKAIRNAEPNDHPRSDGPSHRTNDARLFDAFAARQDRTALAQLFAEIALPAHALAARILLRAERPLAETPADVVQDAFLAVMRRARPGVGDPRAFLLAAVANQARQTLRAAWRRQQHEQAQLRPDASSDHDADDDLGERAVALLDRLPDTERSAVEATVLDGMSSRDAAAMLGRRAGTIDVQVHRGLARLRALLSSTAGRTAITPAILIAALQSSAAGACLPATVSGAAPLGFSASLAALAMQGPLPSVAGSFATSALAKAALCAAMTAVPALLIWGLWPAGTAPSAPPSAPPPAIAGSATAGSATTAAGPLAAPASAPWRGRAGALLAWLRSDNDMHLALDGDHLRDLLAQQQPTSLFADPAVAPAIADLRVQLRRLAEQSSLPDFAQCADAFGGCSFAVGSATSGALTASLPYAVVAFDLGTQATAAYAAWKAAFPVDPTTWQVRGGNGSSVKALRLSTQFVLNDGPRSEPQQQLIDTVLPTSPWKSSAVDELLPCIPTLIPGWPQQATVERVPDGLRVRTTPAALGALIRHLTMPPALPREAPAFAVWRPARLLRELRRYDPQDAFGIGMLFGADAVNLGSTDPCISVRLMPGSGSASPAWTLHGTSDFADALGLRPMPDWLRTMLAWEATWAGGGARLHPQVLVELIAKAMDLNDATAMRLARGTDGSVGLVLTPGSPFPGGTLVVGLHPQSADAIAALTELFAYRGYQRGSASPHGQLWTYATPIGLITILIAADRIVVSTGDPLAPPKTGTAEPVPSPIPAAAIAWARIDRSAILPWLPLLLSQVPVKPVPLENTDLDIGIDHLRQVLLHDSINQGGIPNDHLIAHAQRILHAPQFTPRMDLTTDSATEPEALSAAAATAIARLRLASGGAFEPAAHLACYGAPIQAGEPPIFDTAFLRTGPDAYLAISRHGDRDSSARLTRAQIAALRSLPGGHPLRPLGNRTVENLPILTLAEQPRLDLRRLIPSMNVLARHLPSWTFSASHATAAGKAKPQLTWREEGWPLLSAGFGILAGEMLYQHPPEQLAVDAIDRRAVPDLEKRHAARLLALKRIKTAIEHGIQQIRMHRGPQRPRLPALSQLIAQSGIPMAELAALFDGRVPTPADLDRLGRYVPCDWTGANNYDQSAIRLHRISFVPILTIALPGPDGQPEGSALIVQSMGPVAVTSMRLPTTRQAGDAQPSGHSPAPAATSAGNDF